MRFHPLSLLAFFFIPFFGSSCVGEPEFAKEPAIKFESIVHKSFNSLDSVIITVSFQDGDGNLGLDNSDSEPDFGAENTDGTPNPFFNNFYIRMMKKEGETYSKIELPDGVEFDARFPRVGEGSESPVEGNLTRRLRLDIGVFDSPFISGDTLKFEIQIADRAKNVSNIVETPDIILKGFEE
ncbi:hypothetical protein [Sediminitomix flava]|uniref:Lipoprotein n=1 Tax=Sediminitomix flava TaxID=379075 RepID=A0A315ZWP5_SEDFL|nr:hypothetical protein [Sediminitomix flava]PWJ41113.1 hypothetical protein BC781_104388 [Sediminitomix flava]